MDWVKKNWMLLACGAVALAGVGVGLWSWTGFNEVQAQADGIGGLIAQLDGMTSGSARADAANEAKILAARKYYESNNKGMEEARMKALAVNERKPLRDDVFPDEKAPDSGFRFRDAYRAAMARLPEVLNAGKAPTASLVDLMATRMEDKLRKEANLTSVGTELRVPKPPQVQPWAPVSAMPGRSRMTAVGDERLSFGSEMDPARRGGFSLEMDPARRGGGEEFMPGRYGGTAYRSAVPTDQSSAVTIPSPEQLRPKAKQAVTYQIAKSIWTYVSDDTFETHPVGAPGVVDRPRPEDLWAAQVFYWIELDVAQALRRVNEQAVKTRNLPEDQRCVPYLPVKHLVSVRISDYIVPMTTDQTGRAVGLTVLHRATGAVYSGGATGRFGAQSASFTDRSRNAEYDVVHFSLNLVVDARDLPQVLTELCRQNFFTPISVQYRNVDVTAAGEAGYLYGAAPALNVDVVCEALFFRKIFESKMPQIVKDILDGKAGGGAGAGYLGG